MTRKLTFLILAMMFAILGSGAKTWGADVTYTFTPDKATTGNSSTSYVTSAYSFTYNDIGWSFNQWNPSTLQIKTNQSSAGSEFNFKNTSAFSGRIKSVVITFKALTVSNASGLCFVGGTSAISSLSGGSAGTWNSTAKTLTWTPAATEDFTFFAFYQNGKVASGSNFLAEADAIVITYEYSDTPSTDPVINAEDVELAYDATSGEISYSITNPNPEAFFGAETFASWISHLEITNDKVTFDTEVNTAAASRTATITLNYTGAVEKVVNVTQAGDPSQISYAIDFESEASAYTEWEFTNMTSKKTGDITAYEGTYYGTTDGKETASITTKNKVATPGTLTCWVSKLSNNTTSSTWKIQVSSDKSTWTDVKTQSATSMNKGEWVEFSADLSDYTDVYVRVYYDGTSAVRAIDALDITKPSSVATPTFNPVAGTYNEAQSVSIVCANEGAAIYYTLDGTEPSNSSTPYTEAITINETTTVKAIAYVGDEASNVATATYTILTPLTTMDEIFAAATEAGSNATDILVTFDDWVISGVKNDNAYLTDGTKGLIIYESDHGFEVGDILTGTVSCKVQLYQGSAELIALTSESEGLTVTEGGSVSPVTMTIDQITSGVYTGAVITIENVTYNSSDESLSDGTNTIKPYNKLYSDMSFTNDKEYNVTGVYLQYNNTKEIMPRNAEDIYPIPATEYDITLNQPMYGGGTIFADKEKAAAGETVTLTAIPDTHYHFAGWIVYYGLGEEIIVDENNQFIMPASVVTISAFFAEDAMYSAAYYYNGVSVHYSDPMYAGPIGTLYDPTDMTPPAGFTFVGWSTSMASTEPIDGTYTISSDIDLYAIFEKASTSRENDEVSFVKVTEAPEDWSGEYLLVYEKEDDENDVTSDIAWNGADEIEGFVNVTIDNGIITDYKDAAILTIAPMANPGDYSILVNNKYITGIEDKNGGKNGIGFEDEPQSNTISIDPEGNAIITSTIGSTIMRFNGASNQLRFRYYTSTSSVQTPVQLYKKSGSTSGTIGRYTRVYDNAYPATGSLLSVEGPSIIVSGYILDIYSVDNDNPANLIIEDGAQLIQNCEGVKATVLKSIKGYSDEASRDGYYLVANPTATNASEEDEYDALDGCTAAFDLYTFNPAAAFEWVNIGSTTQKVTFERSKGYLYANAQDMTLHFRGYLLPANEPTSIDLVYYEGEEGDGREFPGFNLIGNPYTCNAYVEGYNFYTMVDDELQAAGTRATIAPCEGFFVEATEAGQSVTISTTAPATASQAMSLTVSQNRGNVIDRAIVNFNGSNNLHKFMMNPAHTNLSIAKGGETFAAISTEAEGELPVNFKAEKNGTYTITVNTENVDAEYLHLIDNMTGMDTDLLSTPSYTFDAKTSDYASRFKLVFGVKNDNEEMSQASSFAYINNGEIVISNEGRATLQVIDVLGRIVSSEEINGECRISTNGLTAGLYILNLNGMTQKIVVR